VFSSSKIVRVIVSIRKQQNLFLKIVMKIKCGLQNSSDDGSYLLHILRSFFLEKEN
jgi:hypothetical protein